MQSTDSANALAVRSLPDDNLHFRQLVLYSPYAPGPLEDELEIAKQMQLSILPAQYPDREDIVAFGGA